MNKDNYDGALMFYTRLKDRLLDEMHHRGRKGLSYHLVGYVLEEVIQEWMVLSNEFCKETEKEFAEYSKTNQ